MLYWGAAILLVIANAACLAANLLMLPGNWLMVGSLCLFLLAAGTSTGPDWSTLLIVIGLAIVGELLELLAGSAAASQKGASRRALTLSVAGSMVCSIAGTFLIPVPVIGNAIGAVVGAAAGAYAGAWLGEAWIGSEPDKRKEIGKAAMTGRMAGMLAKLAIGAAIFVFQLVSLW
ncbi:MAG: DUF456 domain-containing protein [Planctomycetaceae bacterium]